MGLPQVEEGPPVRGARRIASFKVAGKSFVGLEAEGKSMTVGLSEQQARAFQAQNPRACEEIWQRGRRFMGLRVNLPPEWVGYGVAAIFRSTRIHLSDYPRGFRV